MDLDGRLGPASGRGHAHLAAQGVRFGDLAGLEGLLRDALLEHQFEPAVGAATEAAVQLALVEVAAVLQHEAVQGAARVLRRALTQQVRVLPAQLDAVERRDGIVQLVLVGREVRQVRLGQAVVAVVPRTELLEGRIVDARVPTARTIDVLREERRGAGQQRDAAGVRHG